jgi:teichuronic acid biosynthesis glycosyltransferase TuaH
MTAVNHAPPRDHVFTFSYETYNDAVARGMMRPPDRILQTLMASSRVRRLIVANPYRSLVSTVGRRLSGAQAAFPATERQKLVQPVRIARSDATSPRRLVGAFRSYDGVLREAAQRMGLEAPCVITTNPLVAAFAPFAWASTVTYFGRDDWLSAQDRSAYWPAYRAAYQQIREAELGVVAVSQEIIDRIEPRGPAAVVPNGVDPREWSGPMPAPPDWLAEIPEPRAIYVGTLDSRLDTEGLSALAAQRPDLSIVLLGPEGDASETRIVRGIPNVHIHDGVGRAELVAALRNSQLSLLAHRRTPLTEAMSPLKVYEYLAAGLPVVSIDLPPVRGLGDRVIFADSTAEMADAVDVAMRMGPAAEADRLAWVEANSWSARHQVILDMSTRTRMLHRNDEQLPLR